MSETMAQVPSDSPLMIAWEAYKLTPDYATNRKWALYEAHVDGALWAAFCAGFANQPATPPTPPRDAVREALVRVLGAGTSELDAYEALGAGLGLDDPSPHRIADALLAAVSRPAEARGEPWGYACRVRYTDNVASDWWIRFRTEELPTSHQAQVIPLYTRPAPVVTEAMAIAAMREFSAQKGESHDALWSALDDKTRAELVSEWQHIVGCALAAARGEA